MAEDVAGLFEEFAARYVAGERPDAVEYLDRAGDRADELARVLGAFVERAPAPEPDEETAAVVGAWIAGEAPLVHLRARRGVRREQVVSAVMDALRIDESKRAKVARSYHELENGLSSPARVDRRVLAAIAGALRAKVEDLLFWAPRPLEPRAAYLRLPPEGLAAPAPARAAVSARRTEAEPEEYDEVDRLFGREPGAR